MEETPMTILTADQLIDLVAKMIVNHNQAVVASIRIGDPEGAGKYAAKLVHFVRTSIPGVA
jgi:hypothetical protein